MGDTVLRLVPSNWFYNLSVYGFLRVLNKECKVNLKEVFKEDGSVEIDLEKHGLLEETEEIAPGIRSVKLWDCYTKAMFERKPVAPFMENLGDKDVNALFQILKDSSENEFVEKLYSLTVKIIEKFDISTEILPKSDLRRWFKAYNFKSTKEFKKQWKYLVQILNEEILKKLNQLDPLIKSELKAIVFEADETYWEALTKKNKKFIEFLEKQIRIIYKIFIKRFAVNLIKARFDDFLFAKGGEFENLINVQNEHYRFITPILIKLLNLYLNWQKENISNLHCQFCGEHLLLNQFLDYLEAQQEKMPILKKKWKELQTILRNIAFLNIVQIKNLAPSKGEFLNSFWNLNSSVPLCLVCNILFLFYPLGLTDIGGGRRIFVNAPSFELIWKLNNHIEKIHSKAAYKDIKTLFGLGFIDLVLDLNVKLGTWQKLSTEVIVFQGQSVDFYEIPPQILELLEDKRISSLLAELNNLKLLEGFMSGNFKLFEVLIHRLLRSAESNKDDELLKEFGLTYSPDKVKNLSKLYGLIVSKLKKTAEVGV